MRKIEIGANRKGWGEDLEVVTDGAEGQAYSTAIRARRTARRVALNESGTQRIGEDHAGARLTDAQVEAMRDAFEEHPLGHPQHIGYRALAKLFNCSKRTARDICNYRTRNQYPARWKTIA